MGIIQTLIITTGICLIVDSIMIRYKEIKVALSDDRVEKEKALTELKCLKEQMQKEKVMSE